MKKPLIFIFSLIVTVLILKYQVPELEILESLSKIKSYHQTWLQLYDQKPIQVSFIFLAFNTVMAALPVPGISMISFIGGMLFGFWQGALFSSLATALGNLGGFLIARFFLQEWVLKKYGESARIFQKKWQSEGVRTLLSFRLFPFIPSFVANLIMGTSSLHWWTFCWASWLGRIPMVVVYTWAGVEFIKIQSLADILSPKIILAFVALAALPWLFNGSARTEEG